MFGCAGLHCSAGAFSVQRVGAALTAVCGPLPAAASLAERRLPVRGLQWLQRVGLVAAGELRSCGTQA